MARFSGNVRGTNKNHETLVFNYVITNEGNAYDSRTGIFTTPTKGIYSFTWSILNFPNQNVHTELVQNSNIIMGNHAETANARRSTTTTSAVLRLQRGDKVWIWRHIAQSSGIHGERWSSFQGIKI